ncbi:MAG: SulP family inorganic anion transporter, partial [Polaribacter sp.]|nr:SulP family inorganic anion transporter [Polaribacter sp.]
VFSLGFIVNFLSKPVITGFTSAVALIIGFNQFRNLFGADFIQSDQIQYILKDVWFKINTFNTHTTLIGLVSVVIIIIFRRINKKLPNALFVVVLGIFIMKYFGDNFNDVSIVKDIPSGLPGFGIPEFNLDQIRELLPIAFTLVMVGYLETISIGKSLEAKQDVYRIRANQELIALGLSNMVGSFFKAYPTASSFSRSAINQESGAKTGMAALISVVMVVITLLFLTPLFYHLPKTVLAAIIIVAVFGLINFKEAAFLWKANNLDFWLMLSTFLATLFLGIEYGIAVGVSLSLIVLIYKTSRPYVAEIGKVPGSNFYRNINRFEEVIISDEILVFRFDAQIFYANSNYFRDNLDEMAAKKGKALKLIVIDAESINRVDSTGVEMLKERIKYYQKKDVKFYFAGVKGPVRDDLFRSGILQLIGLNHFFMRANEAVKFFETGDRKHQEKYAKYIHQAYK